MKEKGLRALIRLLQELRRIDPEFPIQYVLCLSEIAHRQGLSITELAQCTGITLSTVSRIVGTLSSKRGPYQGLIDVRFSPIESRRKELFLTSRGTALIRQLNAGFETIFLKKAA